MKRFGDIRNQQLKNMGILFLAGTIIVLSIVLPPQLARWTSPALLGVVKKEDAVNQQEYFRYSLNTSERLFIVSMALNNRNILQSDYAASLREKALRTNRDSTAASYAYVENSRGILPTEIDAEKAMEVSVSVISKILNDALGIEDFVPTNPCTQTLYTAVDLLEPQKNVSVWQITYQEPLPPMGNPFSLMEAYVDAETGNVYGFAIRTQQSVLLDADILAKTWLKTLDVSQFTDITEQHSMAQVIRQYKRFAVDGMNQEKTVFAVGNYKGINEIFVQMAP